MSSGVKSLNAGKGKPFVMLAFIVTLLVSAGFIAVPFLLKAYGDMTFYNYFYETVNAIIELIKSGAAVDAIIEALSWVVIDIFFAIAIIVFAIMLIVNLFKIGKYGFFTVFKMVKSFFVVFVIMCFALLISALMPIYPNIKGVMEGGGSLQGAINAFSPNTPNAMPIIMVALYGGCGLLCVLLTGIAGTLCPDIRMGGKHAVINFIRFIVIAMVVAVLFVTPAFTLSLSAGSETGYVKVAIAGTVFENVLFTTSGDYIFYIGGGIFFAFVPMIIMLLRKPFKAFALQNADYALAQAVGSNKKFRDLSNANRCRQSIKVRLLVTGIVYLVIHFALKPLLGLFGLPVTINEFYFFLGFGIAAVIGAIVLFVFETILEKTTRTPEITSGDKE
ncbi:MAG: hypothetical protein SPL13_05225 [Clostridia bacterium]|nr:hypothetical protein [Clostridia bacterium]